MLKNIEKFLYSGEKYVEKHLSHMKMSCYRLILIDSVLWGIFIIYYIGHFFYSKQFTKFEKKHKGYEKLLNDKDIIIFVFLGLAVLLYLHFFILARN